GNFDRLINWEADGREVKNYAVFRNKGGHWSRYIQNLQYFYQEGLTWSVITSGDFSMRYLPSGFINDYSGCAVFKYENSISLEYLLGIANFKFTNQLLKMINPTINMQPGNISKIPIVKTQDEEKVNKLVNLNIKITKTDWD